MAIIQPYGGAGLVRRHNGPSFHATMSASQTNISSNVSTVAQFNTESHDSNGAFNTSNYRFTPGVAGQYYIYAQVNMWDNGQNADYEQQNINLMKNTGVHVYRRRHLAGSAGGSGLAGASYNIINVAAVLTLDSDDYVEIQASVYNTNFDIVNLASYFCGFRVND